MAHTQTYIIFFSLNGKIFKMVNKKNNIFFSLNEITTGNNIKQIKNK